MGQRHAAVALNSAAAELHAAATLEDPPHSNSTSVHNERINATKLMGRLPTGLATKI